MLIENVTYLKQRQPLNDNLLTWESQINHVAEFVSAQPPPYIGH